jgi:hypothetical protein
LGSSFTAWPSLRQSDRAHGFAVLGRTRIEDFRDEGETMMSTAAATSPAPAGGLAP